MCVRRAVTTDALIFVVRIRDSCLQKHLFFFVYFVCFVFFVD